MLTFRTDESNFDQGGREGLRIASGSGLKADFDEFAPDADTLGLWHLHDGACQGEGTGLENAAGGGHDLSNHGAAPDDDGYRLVRADGDYLDAAFPSQPARSRLTLECWVRAWTTTVGQYGAIAELGPSTSDLLGLRARRHSSAASSSINGELTVGGAVVGSCVWTSAAADALLASPEPWHIALVLDAPASLALYVNGVRRALDTTGIAALATGNQTLRLGRYMSGWTGYDLSAVVDEVRLSALARYAAGFTPHRLLQGGLYASPTFDAARIGADWVDLVSEAAVPEGCSIAWEVRAADELDGFGFPQALWQAYGGDPAAIPDGRYFQWRATLSASTDHLVSPALESVEAVASEAGYNLYRGMGPGPQAIDYAAPFERVGPGVTEQATGPLAAGAVHWFGIRPVDARGIESPTTQGEARLELDGSGEPVPDRPAGVLALAGRPLAGGAARLTWRYRVGESGVVPEVFRIYGDGGTGVINYETPLGEVACEEAKASYAWESPPLAEGAEHQLAVRAVGAGDLWDEQPSVAILAPDATPPGVVDALEAEVVS